MSDSKSKNYRGYNRRVVLKLGAMIGGFFWLCPAITLAKQLNSSMFKLQSNDAYKPIATNSRPLGTDSEGFSHILCSRNNTPEKNMYAVLEMLGGIERLIGPDDIVLLKPNSQWWNQGMTNTNAMKAFIEAVLNRHSFRGEVIIADNHQYNEPNSRGWTTDYRNGDFNYNELVTYFNYRGYKNVTKYNWRPVNPQIGIKEFNPANFSKRIEGPWQGDGYVYDENLVYKSPLGRRCLLTYPIFTSAYSGTVIDFKNGVWRDDSYSGQPVKFINFSAINHHSSYAGVTGSVKNYMGIVDMSCGYPRGGPIGFYNAHHVGLRELPELYKKYVPWRIQKRLIALLRNLYKDRYFCHTGGCLGSFMRQVRMADINLITAHWIGYGSRTDPELSGYPKALIASTDPVALDYWVAREILLPLTEQNRNGHTFTRYNDPQIDDGPSKRFLLACHNEGIGNILAEKIKVTYEN